MLGSPKVPFEEAVCHGIIKLFSFSIKTPNSTRSKLQRLGGSSVLWCILSQYLTWIYFLVPHGPPAPQASLDVARGLSIPSIQGPSGISSLGPCTEPAAWLAKNSQWAPLRGRTPLPLVPAKEKWAPSTFSWVHIWKFCCSLHSVCAWYFLNSFF